MKVSTYGFIKGNHDYGVRPYGVSDKGEAFYDYVEMLEQTMGEVQAWVTRYALNNEMPNRYRQFIDAMVSDSGRTLFGELGGRDEDRDGWIEVFVQFEERKGIDVAIVTVWASAQVPQSLAMEAYRAVLYRFEGAITELHLVTSFDKEQKGMEVEEK